MSCQLLSHGKPFVHIMTSTYLIACWIKLFLPPSHGYFPLSPLTQITKQQYYNHFEKNEITLPVGHSVLVALTR